MAEVYRSDGWEVLARNWRGGGGELDLVVCRAGHVRIVEVKARSADDPVGLDAIDARKRRKLVRAAEAFLAEEHDDLVETVAFAVAYVHDDGRVELIDDAFDA